MSLPNLSIGPTGSPSGHWVGWKVAFTHCSPRAMPRAAQIITMTPACRDASPRNRIVCVPPPRGAKTIRVAEDEDMGKPGVAGRYRPCIEVQLLRSRPTAHDPTSARR
jgi:hypothetical protein